jgi:hypothetical protein
MQQELEIYLNENTRLKRGNPKPQVISNSSDKVICNQPTKNHILSNRAQSKFSFT